MSSTRAFANTLARGLPAHWPLPRRAAARLLERWVDEALQRTEDEFFANRLARACPVPGVPPEAYLHRVVQAPGAPDLLAGIRFKGGQLAWPFVELLAWEAPLQRPEEWAAVRGRLTAAFSDFSPRALRVFWPGTERPAVGCSDATTLDQWLVAARLSRLHDQPRPWGEVSVDLRLLRDLSWYPRYREAHATWREGAGGLGAEVPPQTRETFARCLATGLVVGLYENNRWRGVAAAYRQREAAVDGYRICALFLDAPLRGRRRAAPLLRALVDRLPDGGRDSVHGPVHRLNLPARNTARRCGIVPVAGWWFASLGAEPDDMALRW